MRKTYEREFKLKACQEIDSGKATITAVAQEFSISRPVVSRWLVEYQRHGQRAFSGKGNRLPGTAKFLLFKIESNNWKWRTKS